jgi:ubiquinone/menaquinone biosynthesis C-methylase UbiE
LGNISPGGTKLISEAIEAVGLKRGDKVLDIGCGEGETLEYLQDNFGVRCIGIDKSVTQIQKGKGRNPQLDLREGAADFLEFSSLTFNAVIMECILSVTEMKTEVIHEAYCVLKAGGKLIIADLCKRDEAAARSEGTERESSIATENDDGTVNVGKLINACNELGFKQLLWEDKSKDLDVFMIEKIMAYGSMEKYFDTIIPDGETKDSFCRASAGAGKLGYFLLIMEKPKKG